MTFKHFTRLQVIAVAMDVFTDVDIFKEIITATLRGVAVYVLLDQSHFAGFLTMSRRAGINIQDLKVRWQQRRGECFLSSLHHSLPSGLRAAFLSRRRVTKSHDYFPAAGFSSRAASEQQEVNLPPPPPLPDMEAARLASFPSSPCFSIRTFGFGPFRGPSTSVSLG